MDEGLGARIVQAYKGAGLNRNQFAKKLGTVYHNVIRWEEGAIPGSEYLSKIASITGVSVDWLLHGETHVERDSDRGHPATEAYLTRKAESGDPVSAPHAAELRSLRRSMGPDSITEEVLEGMLRGLRARDARRSLERPLVPEARIDVARGQRALPPTKKKRS